MKRLLLLTVLSLLVAGTAFSQAGSIGLFPDAAGTVCDFVDAGGLVQVHYYHGIHTGATASQWMLDLNGLPWVHLGDQIQFPTVIGTSITGISIGYGNCQAAPTYLGVSNFFGSNAPTCSSIRIVADPASLSGEIEGVDCATPANKTYPTGMLQMVNADPGCSCPGWSPVESSTWGSVKALYR
jgi:hypothetical protein